MARKIAFIAFCATLLYRPAKASPQAPEIQYVGAIHIDTSRDAKVVADWYSKFFGVETRCAPGVCFGKMSTPAGQFAFSIHERSGAPTASSPNVTIVFRVDDYSGYVKVLEGRGITTKDTESDSFGRFANYKDPDGNVMTIWGM